MGCARRATATSGGPAREAPWKARLARSGAWPGRPAWRVQKFCLGHHLACSGVRFPLGARMRLVIRRRQVLEIEPGVDLRGRNIGVTQQFLHGAQIMG